MSSIRTSQPSDPLGVGLAAQLDFADRMEGRSGIWRSGWVGSVVDLDAVEQQWPLDDGGVEREGSLGHRLSILDVNLPADRADAVGVDSDPTPAVDGRLRKQHMPNTHHEVTGGLDMKAVPGASQTLYALVMTSY